VLSWLWTSLLHVPILLLHGHSSIPDTVFHINTCYTRCYHFMSLYHCYTDTVTLDITISCSCTIMSLLHWFICIYVYCFYILVAWITTLVTWNIITWIFMYFRYMTIFLLLILIHTVTGHVSYWFSMCGGGYLLNPTSHVSCFPLSCLMYQHNSCPVIVWHVSCIIIVPDILCNLYLINITWDGGGLMVD